MPFPFKISVVGFGVFATMQVTPSNAWDYTNTAWEEDSCGAANPNQSPIDIVVAAVAEGSAQVPPQQFDFVWMGAPDSATESAIAGDLVINDHTWEVEWDIHNASTNPYGITIGDKLYRLRQFHYHSPSEHTVNGEHFDMEAHHVHFCEGVSCATPDPDDEILVVAVFLRVGAAANTYLDTFWDQYNTDPEAEITGLANPYVSFMPPDKSYYSYTGSTTTPPCQGNVKWRLMQDSVEMSREQLTAYHEGVNSLSQPAIQSAQPDGVTEGWDFATTKTNNRPVQELGDRTVLRFVGPQVATDPGAAPDESSWWVMPLLVGLAAAALLAAGVCLFLNSNKEPNAKPAKRGVKPKPRPPSPAPKEETVPLMPPPPLLVAPNLSMVVPAQPLMQAMPQAYTTAVRPVAMAPYGQAPMFLQP